jgi:hypothetical protein
MRIETISVVLTSWIAAGCMGGEPTSGAIELSLSSTAPEIAIHTSGRKAELASVVVTVHEIHASLPAGGWQPVSLGATVVDLLKLDRKTLASLGLVNLPAGRASQLLLRISDGHVVLKSGERRPLEVPDNGVIKVSGDLKLAQCAAGQVIVDLAPKISLENNRHVLRCGARIKTQNTRGSCGGSDGGASKPDLSPTPDLSPKPDQGGSCGGVVCMPGETCSNGVCVADPCAGVLCAPDEMCRAGVCVPNDPCAGVVCMPGETCTNGVCNPSSPPDMGGGRTDGSCRR